MNIECQAVLERDFSLLGSRALDLSADRILVRSDTKVNVGDDVLVTLRLPGDGLWLDAKATVSRIVESAAGGRDRCVALAFSPLDNLGEQLLCDSLLDALLEELEASDGAARPTA